jgi:hypothetical protein
VYLVCVDAPAPRPHERIFTVLGSEGAQASAVVDLKERRSIGERAAELCDGRERHVERLGGGGQRRGVHTALIKRTAQHAIAGRLGQDNRIDTGPLLQRIDFKK